MLKVQLTIHILPVNRSVDRTFVSPLKVPPVIVYLSVCVCKGISRCSRCFQVFRSLIASFKSNMKPSGHIHTCSHLH